MQTDIVINTVKVVFYVVLIGLLIQAGTLLTSFIAAIVSGPEAAEKIYMGFDHSALYDYSRMYYFTSASFLLAIGILKAHLAYLVVKIFHVIDFEHPFTSEAALWIKGISHTAFGVGIVAISAETYSKWLYKHLPENVQEGMVFKFGAGEFLLFAGVLFIIAYVWEKGVHIQSENELTV